MIMKTTWLFFAILFSTKLTAQNPFYIGHSLVNFDMPAMVQGLAIDGGSSSTTHYAQQIINGAPLRYNYDNYASAQGMSYRSAFPNGNFNTLIATEAVPLQGHITYNDAHKYADSIYRYAKNNNNNVAVKYFFYETWHCTSSGLQGGCAYDNTANSNTLWHPRLLSDFSLWTGIVNYVRSQFPTDEIWMVPAGQAFYNLTTRINAGNLPGISNVNQLFRDDIHLTNKGNYFVACVMYACIYGKSPVGLTANINNVYNVPFADMPTPAKAQVMQEVAWATVTTLTNWTGVSSALPISINSFVGNCNTDQIVLQWTAIANNKDFIIEKSSNGTTWKDIGKVAHINNASSNQKYSFVDYDASVPNQFYRLKQVDVNGTYTYFNIINVENCNKKRLSISLSPNPVKDIVTIKLQDIDNKRQVTFYNAIGVKVKQVYITQMGTINISDLASGVYFISIENEAQAGSFIKQ
jgi:hypothetical protein